jgi:hypothetical protein
MCLTISSVCLGPKIGIPAVDCLHSDAVQHQFRHRHDVTLILTEEQAPELPVQVWSLEAAQLSFGSQRSFPQSRLVTHLSSARILRENIRSSPASNTASNTSKHHQEILHHSRRSERDVYCRPLTSATTMMLNATSTNPLVTSSSINASISIATSSSISDESALWTHLTLKQLTVLATSLHLVSPGALDTSSELLRDEKSLVDLDFMSRSLAGELMYYLPKVEGVENRKCRVSWTFKKSGKDGECGFVDCSEQRKREELSKLDRAGIASRYSCRYAEYSTLSEPAWITVRR